MKPLHHLSCVESHARLHQLADGRFQVVEEGELAPLMTGYEYVLVERDFAEYLSDLGLFGLTIVDAIIYEPWLKQEFRTHRELQINHHFYGDEIDEVDLKGERFSVMDDQHVFVTEPLKERLEASPFKYLCFTAGLYGFAAGR